MRRLALAVFIMVWLTNGLGLLVDQILVQCKLDTVTKHSESRPWLAAIIVIWNLIGIQALMVHFFFLRGRDGDT